jgi:hypothetical protein
LQVLLAFRDDTRRLGVDANRPYLPDDALGKVPLFLDRNAYYQCLTETVIDRPVNCLSHPVELFIGHCTHLANDCLSLTVNGNYE